MARIAGVTLPSEKNIEIGLTYIFGIGRNLSLKVLKNSDIKPSVKVKDLNEKEINLLKENIEKNYKVEGERRREILMDIKRLKEIKSYRGTRHEKHLPARGQRTKTNTRTVRGNTRKTMGSGKKPTSQKT